MGNRSSSSSGTGARDSAASTGAGSSASAYPAEHYRQASLRGAPGRLSSSTGEGRSGTGSRGSRAGSSYSSSGSGSAHHHGHAHGGRSPDQTVCPQCQRVLLIPPNAPLFRCPCGVLFRTESLRGGGRQSGRGGPGGALFMGMGAGGSSLSSLMLGAVGADLGGRSGNNGGGGGGTPPGRAVLCRRCRRLSVVPATHDPGEVTICRCGALALPLNDMVMSLLAEGELGLIGGQGGRRGGAFGGEMEGASRDLIEMLPTCRFSKAVYLQQQQQQQQLQEQQRLLKEQEQRQQQEEEREAAAVGGAGGGKGQEEEAPSAVAGEGTGAADGGGAGGEKVAAMMLAAAPVAVVEGKQAAAAAAAATAVPVAEEEEAGSSGSDGKKASSAAVSCCAATAALTTLSVAEAAAPGAGKDKAKEGEEEEEEVGSEHGDDLSCRVCFEDYEDGDEQRVLPCFHKFHVACIDEWLTRKKLCPLCLTPLDVILNPPDFGEGAAVGATA